jgi:hypothetical protein
MRMSLALTKMLIIELTTRRNRSDRCVHNMILGILVEIMITKRSTVACNISLRALLEGYLLSPLATSRATYSPVPTYVRTGVMYRYRYRYRTEVVSCFLVDFGAANATNLAS